MRHELGVLALVSSSRLLQGAPMIYSVPTVDDNSGSQSEEHTVERTYRLHRAWGEDRERMYHHQGPLQLEPCTMYEHMLASPCFVNEGSTSVHVPDVRGYQIGCNDFRQFTCTSNQLNQDKVGRNQRCVACARKSSSSGCLVRTVWDLSCG